MLGDPASSGPSGLPDPAVSLTTIPLDSAPPNLHPVVPSLHWRRSETSLTIRAPRTRHLLPAVGGVMVTSIVLALAALRLANLPVARDGADRLGSVILLALPCLFGLMGLLTLLPVICPPRLRVDGGGVTLVVPTGFLLCRRHLDAGTFELRVHEWGGSAPVKLATLFLRDRRHHATYPVFHRYPATELADVVRSLAGLAIPATR
jgi:hypothetical protein